MTGRTSYRHRDWRPRNAIAAAGALAIVATLAIAAPALASEFSVPAGQNTANFTTFEENNRVTIQGNVQCISKDKVATFIGAFMDAVNKLNNAGRNDAQASNLASKVLQAGNPLSWLATAVIFTPALPVMLFDLPNVGDSKTQTKSCYTAAQMDELKSLLKSAAQGFMKRQ